MKVVAPAHFFANPFMKFFEPNVALSTLTMPIQSIRIISTMQG